MPIRLTPLVTGQFYHIFNRGVEARPIFLSKRDYTRAVETLRYYQFGNPSCKFCQYLKLPIKQREMIDLSHKNENRIIDIICFALMPNHFHLLLKQTAENGISKYIKIFSDSYTKYFNIKNKRNGPLLQGQFKAVLVESNEQLCHLSRYIHLNPYSSYLVKSVDETLVYPWSSFAEYLNENEREGLCQKETIMENFRHIENYKQFVLDQADYQRKLDLIKHLSLD